MSSPSSTSDDASQSNQPSQPTASQSPGGPASSLREVARRVFAVEFNDAIHTFRESDEDRAPRYALLPTGVPANRVFVVGTLTEVTDVGSDTEYLQARVVDPTGTVFTYAGQYQPDAMAALRAIDSPAYVAVVGKPRTYETDEGQTLSSVRPESVTPVDEATRDHWLVETAEHTIDRLDAFDPSENEYAALASETYDLAETEYVEAVRDVLATFEDGEDEST